MRLLAGLLIRQSTNYGHALMHTDDVVVRLKPSLGDDYYVSIFNAHTWWISKFVIEIYDFFARWR